MTTIHISKYILWLEILANLSKKNNYYKFENPLGLLCIDLINFNRLFSVSKSKSI